jgi:hypothetical protein
MYFEIKLTRRYLPTLFDVIRIPRPYSILIELLYILIERERFSHLTEERSIDFIDEKIITLVIILLKMFDLAR